MSKTDRSNRIVLTSLKTTKVDIVLIFIAPVTSKYYGMSGAVTRRILSGWRATGRRAAKDFKSETDAKRAAYLAVAWLSN